MCTFTRCKTANHNPEAMRNPDRLVECVSNISEGRNASIIQSIADEVESVDGVKLLHVDVGEGTNRTVFTFAGEPEAVLEAAFRLIRKTAELVDMRRQRGAHPRMGATDVCPFIPVRGIEMEEVVELAHRLGERVGEELGIPGYYYEYAAKTEARRRLEHCRRGQYEGLDKLATQEGRPDFGPAEFNERVRKTGAVAIGARKFLIAYNYGRAGIGKGAKGWRRETRAGKNRGRCGAEPRSGRVEIREGIGVVHRGIRHRPSVAQPDKHRRNANSHRL